MMAGPNDPLFLQVKEARASVLEPYAGKSLCPFRPAGGGRPAADAVGQRSVPGLDARSGRPAFLHPPDARREGPADGRDVSSQGDVAVSEACGWALARRMPAAAIRRHWRATWKGDRFEQAMADFAEAYADQNDRDYHAFVRAILAERLVAAPAPCP